MRLTDRMFDFFASRGDGDLLSPMSGLPAMPPLGGPLSGSDDGLSAALPDLDGAFADLIMTDGSPAVASGSVLGALSEEITLVDGDSGGISSDSWGSSWGDSWGASVGDSVGLVSTEPLFTFDSAALSATSGFAVRQVSAFDHASFDPMAALRESLWHDSAPHIEAAGQSVAADAGDAGMPADTDLTFIDFGSFAKGGNGGGKGGGGGGNGGGGGGDGTLSSYTSGDIGGYNIETKFKGAWTVDLQSAFIDASELISDLITGDISDVFFRGKVIDDIRIDAELKDIDGAGGILGQAGPTAIRTADYLPATAVMQFDIADADAFNAIGLWDDIVFHEMLHSVGFGTVWAYKDLVDGAGGENPLFTGAAATFTYERDFGAIDAVGVPLEQDGGAGTRDSHWDEEIFDNEIMTGYINNLNYLSEMTVASLEDTGYETVWNEEYYVA
ncbi:MAG: hypothetical protein HOF33_11620 [Rhodospirillaceae bacterium]|nr:hypothetical protein [Rhodospirillaceae bacterium]MBT7294064.1 hypothetical protein [Rhodospirillaceae bacterium]